MLAHPLMLFKCPNGRLKRAREDFAKMLESSEDLTRFSRARELFEDDPRWRVRTPGYSQLRLRNPGAIPWVFTFVMRRAKSQRQTWGWQALGSWDMRGLGQEFARV